MVETRGGGVKRQRFGHIYNDIISLDNLLISWQEFLCGKRNRKDVAEFSLHFMDHVLLLYQELINKTYQHGAYQAFKINDPKPRDIHKACVRDRIVHHAIYRSLYPFFERQFVYDSYSCRDDKGTHRAVRRLRSFANIVSHNYTTTAWILKCDIRKFFASIDHAILKNILSRYIVDKDIIWLLGQIIDSFSIDKENTVGLPLGNLTSQLLVNIYMNEFDQFMKRDLKVKYYIRYADDFLILSRDKNYLENLLLQIAKFLNNDLKLSLNYSKVSIKTLSSGVDFLGWVNFPHHRVLRTKTKQRMFKKLAKKRSKESVNSYFGMLSHGDAYEIEQFIQKCITF